MIGIMDLNVPVLYLKWNPNNPHQLLALEKTASLKQVVKKMLVIDYKAGTQKVLYDVMLYFSTIGWHPKKPDHYYYGTTQGDIAVCNI